MNLIFKEDSATDESTEGPVLEVVLGRPPGDQEASTLPGNINESTSSVIAWCHVSNLVACSSAPSSPHPRHPSASPYCIEVNLLNPERPLEHVKLRVPTSSPGVSLQTLAWSPSGCPRVLLAVDVLGQASVWSQPTQGPANVARAENSWQREYTWQEKSTVAVKWLQGLSPYRYPPVVSASSKASLVERFCFKGQRSTSRWLRGSFLCICSVYRDGSLQLHWHSSLPKRPLNASWQHTKIAPLRMSPGGILAADVAVDSRGSVLVVGIPASLPSSVVLWEVKPGENSSQGGQLVQSWAGMAPLPALLMGWPQHLHQGVTASDSGETAVAGRGSPTEDEGDFGQPNIICTSISQFKLPSRGMDGATLQDPGLPQGETLGMDVKFHPGTPEAALFLLSRSGSPKGQGEATWTVQLWEMKQGPLAVHPLLSSSSAAQPQVAIWQSVAVQEYHQQANVSSTLVAPSDDPCSTDTSIRDPMGEAHMCVSGPGSEVAVSLPHGRIHVLDVSNLAPKGTEVCLIEKPKGGPPVTFSPTGCCVATTWLAQNAQMLQVFRVSLSGKHSSNLASASAAWDRQLADRVGWSWVTGLHCWDVVASCRWAAEESKGSVAGLISILDADFHSLPALNQRHHYCPMLDRLKIALLEGSDSPETRAVILDMQARLLLGHLARSVEASLVVPTIPSSWTLSNEAIQQLAADIMAVEPSLVPFLHPYVDAILDLTSHILTRLRRYLQFMKTMVGTSAAALPGGSSAAVAPTSAAIGIGQTAIGGASGLAAKAVASKLVAGGKPEQNLSAQAGQTSVGLSPTIPGVPGVRLLGDRHFLHRLCQLVFFCLFFRRRSPPAVSPITDSAPIKSTSASIRMGNGNAGVGYSSEEVRILFSMLNEMCKRTLALPSTLPGPQAPGTSARLHFPEGQISVAPEAMEAWVAASLQNLPRPKGPDAAGLLMRELELQSPYEDFILGNTSAGFVGQGQDRSSAANGDDVSPWGPGSDDLDTAVWTRKRRFADRDAATGAATTAGMGARVGFLGARRDMLTCTWKTAPYGTWHKCARCWRHTAALASPVIGKPPPVRSASEDSEAGLILPEVWWPAQWVHSCPICGGHWTRLQA